jgi:hypothetical protein
MTGAKPATTRRVCPEPDGRGGICGAVHMSPVCDTCPGHIREAADTFWAAMGTTTPDTGQKRAEPVLAPPGRSNTDRPAKKKRTRPGKRSRATRGNDHEQ